MARRIARAFALLVVSALMAAPPPVAASFAPAGSARLANGVILATQNVVGANLIAAQVFVPAGLLAQPPRAAGIAAVVARMALATPVENATTLSEVAAAIGAQLDFTLEPNDTSFSIECRPGDFPRLLRDLAAALRRPDPAAFSAARAKALTAAGDSAKNPVSTVYAMIRQVRYAGTGYAYAEGGSPLTLSGLTPADADAFAETYRHGQDTIVALAGAVTQAAIAAAQSEFAVLPSTASSAPPLPRADRRRHEVVAHRSVTAPWVAIGYDAPSQFSSDFPTMLVIQALLGRATSVQALATTSSQTPAEEFVGPFYQYAAQPATFAVFLNGAGSNIDLSIANLEIAMNRLRTKQLPAALIGQARRLAAGDFYMQFVDLSEVTWLLGRAAISPQGPAYENSLAASIASVTPADVQRVARHYLSSEVLAVVLPSEGPAPINP